MNDDFSKIDTTMLLSSAYSGDEATTPLDAMSNISLTTLRDVCDGWDVEIADGRLYVYRLGEYRYDGADIPESITMLQRLQEVFR